MLRMAIVFCFVLLSVVSALYSKQNESTADTRGQSQVHCTRQGSTADAKEPLALYFWKKSTAEKFFADTWQKHTREIIKKSTLGKTRALFR